MIIGEVIRLKSISYVVVNKEGTLEKLPDITFKARLYLEIRQGMGKYFSIKEARDFINKHKKVKKSVISPSIKKELKKRLKVNSDFISEKELFKDKCTK